MDIIIKQREQVIDAQGRNRGFKLLIICPHCQEERWVREDATRNVAFTGFCIRCHAKYTTGKMDKHSNWKGGKTKKDGYVYIRLSPDNFYYPMARKSGYVREHRLVMAKSLGRCLQFDEIVHHINNIRDDNRLDNLEIIRGAVYHLLDSNTKSQITRLNNARERLNPPQENTKG